MSDYENDLKARIAELEAEVARRPVAPAIAPPVSANAGPFRGFCSVCNSAHQPGQHSHCLKCKRPYGLNYGSPADTVPCEVCGSRGFVQVPRTPVASTPPSPKMPVYKVDR